MAQKWGAGHGAAMARLGLKEVTHGLLPAFPPGHQIIEEPGLAGNPTQGEVAQARDGPGSGPEQEALDGKMTIEEMKSYARQKAQEAEKGMEKGGHEREQERGGPEM